MKTGERFMRAYPDRWLKEENIRGRGDDGQREGGIRLDQEGAYWRLCLTQFNQEDGYLPNRRAFLCDAVACPLLSYDDLVSPVLDKFFRKTKDGSRLYNVVTRLEWEGANRKTAQAKAANKVRWDDAKALLSLLNDSGDPDGDPSGHPFGDPDGASKRVESRGESKSKRSADRPSGSPKRRAEYDRLMAEPEVATLATFWMTHLGGGATLGLLRAAHELLAVAYDVETAKSAVLALQVAKEHPDELHPKSQARWCLEHNRNPGYVLRPGIVEKLAGEYEQHQRAHAAQPAAPPQSRPKALLPDRAATLEEIRAAQKGEGA